MFLTNVSWAEYSHFHSNNQEHAISTSSAACLIQCHFNLIKIFFCSCCLFNIKTDRQDLEIALCKSISDFSCLCLIKSYQDGSHCLLMCFWTACTLLITIAVPSCFLHCFLLWHNIGNICLQLIYTVDVFVKKKNVVGQM